MKFLGALFAFVALTASTVFAAPSINQEDKTFYYWINTDSKTATVTGVKDKNAQKVTIKPYITVEGNRYYVKQIGAGAFSNTYIQHIVVPSRVQSMNFSPNAFNGARDIRNIELNIENVTADQYAFDGIDKNVGFTGIGVPNLINNYAKVILQSWNLPVGKDYTNVSPDTFNKALYKLAYKVKKNFYLDDKVAYNNSVASVLALKAGGREGIARAYRILARNMGFQYHDVHVGGDGGRYSWNYVYIVKDSDYKRWFNLDIVDTEFRSSRYDASVFKTMDEMKNSIQSNVNPRDWIIYENQYNYPNEFILVNGEKWYYDPPYGDFYSWLVRNRSGVQA